MEEERLSFHDPDFSKLVKKAKRTSYIKNIVISVLVSLLSLTFVYMAGSYIMQYRLERQSEIDNAWHYVKGANVEDAGTSYIYSPFGASAVNEQIKNMDGILFPWGKRQQSFTIFGSSNSTKSLNMFGMGTITDKRIPLYYQGERVIEFFHPTINYEYLPDERNLLFEIDEKKVVEYAFSFDRSYSIKEVEKMFSNHISWFWVDTYSKEELNSDDATGFIGFDTFGFSQASGPMSFVQQLEWLEENGGQYKKTTKKMINALKDKGKWEAENLPIIGVVVTGQPNELKQFLDAPYIRTAVLGVTVDRY